MAPIVATGTGITPQDLDDPDLQQLLTSLKELPGTVSDLTGLEKLAVLLEPWKEEWLFEEQVRRAAWWQL